MKYKDTGTFCSKPSLRGLTIYLPRSQMQPRAENQEMNKPPSIRSPQPMPLTISQVNLLMFKKILNRTTTTKYAPPISLTTAYCKQQIWKCKQYPQHLKIIANAIPLKKIKANVLKTPQQ